MKSFLTTVLTICILSIGFAKSDLEARVSGTVKDEYGEALIGATVVVEGIAGRGAVTDINGNFTLSLDAGDYVLVARYVGYQPVRQEVSLTDGASVTVDFVLPVERVLDAVVVIG